MRALYTQRLVARGGGFRAASLNGWPVDRLAKEIVRMNAQSGQDEIELLQLLYVELEPAIQMTFLDEAGVRHEKGVIDENLTTPYANADAVQRAAALVQSTHGADGVHYLRTIARYSRESWPGIEDLVARIGG